MLRLIPKVVLLMALLAALVVSNAPAFAAFGAKPQGSCTCACTYFDEGHCQGGKCYFDTRTLQCVSVRCPSGCIFH